MGTAHVKSKNSKVSSLLDPPKTKILLQVDVNKTIPVNLLQLTNWSFGQIRTSVQVFQRLSQSPMIDTFIFHKMIPLSKKNCDLMFAKLSNGQKYVSVYEIIGILILTSYQSFTKKFQFLQLLFDFGQKGKITGREFMLIYFSILFGYCRISGQKLPSFHTVEDFGEASFFPGEQESDIFMKEITLRRCIEQYEANPKITELFNRFDHPQYKEIKDDFLIFTTSQLKKYSKSEVDKIYRILFNAYRKGDYQEIEIIEENKEMRRQIRRDSCVKKLLEEKEELVKPYSFESPLKRKSIQSSNKIKSVSLAKLKLSTITPQRQPTERKTLSSFRLKQFQRHPELNTRNRSPKKSIIFLDGKTYNKREMFQSINYFKTLSENDDFINIKEFFKKFAKKAFLKKQVSSLFKYLDFRKTGLITIEDYFRSLYPGLRAEDVTLLIKWFELYKQIYEADSLEINKVKIVEMTDARVLPANTMDRMRQIFDALDHGHKGYLSKQDMRRAYKRGFTVDELEQLIQKYGKNQLIYIGGLCRMLLPDEWTIQGVNISQLQ